MSLSADDIKTHVRKLEKAVKDEMPASHIIDLLEALKKGVQATEAILRETKVGMAVNKLRNNGNDQVVALAKEIVSKWKGDVAKNKPKAAPVRKTSSASPTVANASIPKTIVKTEPGVTIRSKKSDDVDTAVTGDKARDNCVGVLYDALCSDSDAPASRILDLVTALEAEVFKNHKKKVDALYKRKIQSLFLNIKDKKNPGLRKRIISGEITPERLATMETAELASEEQRKEDERIREENLRKSMVAKAPKSYSDQLTCGKCKQKRVSYTQAQTRSADEPMTTFCTCENCGNMWKFS